MMLKNAKDLEVFPAVAKVLGDRGAEIELDKVIQAEVPSLVDLPQVGGSFLWIQTPQGQAFWAAVNRGVLPDGYPTSHRASVGDILILTDKALDAIGFEDMSEGDRMEVADIFTDMDGYDWLVLCDEGRRYTGKYFHIMDNPKFFKQDQKDSKIEELEIFLGRALDEDDLIAVGEVLQFLRQDIPAE